MQVGGTPEKRCAFEIGIAIPQDARKKFQAWAVFTFMQAEVGSLE